MDKEVLIRFIQMIENVLSRINSKRLMVFFAFLLFLVYCPPDTWKMALGGIAFLITITMVWKNPKNTDSL
jgi:ammonia channel protein AmtB